METKSRYQVTAEMELNKRNLINERASLDGTVKEKEREIKIIDRQLEDAIEDLGIFKEAIDTKRTTIDELIKSLEAGLVRIANTQKKQN